MVHSDCRVVRCLVDIIATAQLYYLDYTIYTHTAIDPVVQMDPSIVPKFTSAYTVHD